jgi:hypothetical protein
MSVIFPTNPPKVNIHELPSNTNMITYRVSDHITISAWLNSDIYYFDQVIKSTYDQFHENNCSTCVRNSFSFLEEYMDDDGEINWDDIPGGYEGHCNVYDYGYDGQSCPEGYSTDDELVPERFPISNMVFEIELSYKDTKRQFTKVPDGDCAFLSAGKYEDGVIKATQIHSAANVFGGEDPERICWGLNRSPNNLKAIVDTYFSTPFNNDLTPIHVFKDHCEVIKYEKLNNLYYTDNVLDDVTYLCESADALILLDAAQNIPAFFQLLSAGFTSLNKARHIMMIPVKKCEFEKYGTKFSGYATIPDSMNKSWFITHSGLLVGQI